MAGLMLSNIEIKKNILADEKYKYLFTVDEVNKLVMQGVPFRDAYKIVGQRVEDGTFAPSSPEEIARGLHEGSIGNLSNEQIKKQMEKLIASFPFIAVRSAMSELLK